MDNHDTLSAKGFRFVATGNNGWTLYYEREDGATATVELGPSPDQVKRVSIQHIPARSIRTEYVYPPIPKRDWDWSAVRDGYEPGDPIGYGPTEADAIRDLLDQEYYDD